MKELKQQLNKVKWAEKIHMDVMDGKFVKNKTVQARTLAKSGIKNKFGVHLMALKPHKQIKAYAKLGAEDLIIPAATKNLPETLEEIRINGMKSGIAIEPETPISQVKDALIHADIALVMTVHSGYSGQKFLKEPIQKIKQIKKINPMVIIGIDGGINTNTIKYAREADFVIATSAVTETENPQKSYNELKKRCK